MIHKKNLHKSMTSQGYNIIYKMWLKLKFQFFCRAMGRRSS